MGASEVGNAGAKAYIAPIDYPDSKATIGFVSNLFLLFKDHVALEDAVKQSAALDAETKQSKLFT